MILKQFSEKVRFKGLFVSDSTFSPVEGRVGTRRSTSPVGLLLAAFDDAVDKPSDRVDRCPVEALVIETRRDVVDGLEAHLDLARSWCPISGSVLANPPEPVHPGETELRDDGSKSHTRSGFERADDRVLFGVVE